MKNLNTEEKNRILDSIEYAKKKFPKLDVNQDFWLRFVNSNGHEYYIAITINDVNKRVLTGSNINQGSHICNTGENMNYTKAYKNY